MNNIHQHCILCGRLNPLSLGLEFKVCGENSVEAKFQGNYWLQGYEDLLHGGVVSALLDSAMTNCLFKKSIDAVTGELKVRYYEPIPCRAELTIRATLLESKSRLYILNSEITIDDKCYARGHGKFMRRLAHPASVHNISHS